MQASSALASFVSWLLKAARKRGITVTLPGSSVYAFEGIDAAATINMVESIALSTENSKKVVLR